MITQEIIPYPVVPYKKLFPSSIDAFLELFEGILDSESMEYGMNLEFVIDNRIDNPKVSPVLRLAKSHEAKFITQICKEVYQHTYPYKELMDEKTIQDMIRSPEHHFILFLVEDQVVGCFRCALDFSQKKGYMGGFMLKSPYHGTIDVVKAIIGSYVWMWNTFKDEILVWYCENRTAHAASQYITAVCGIHTIALFPNKDVFYNEIESDVMGITYQKHVLPRLRRSKHPCLIENVIDCYLYADRLYNLGNFNLVSCDLKVDTRKIQDLQKRVVISCTRDTHDYQHIRFSIEANNASFTFLHTPHIQNCEKITYHVSSNEELFVFMEYFRDYMKEHQVRYSEIFVSAYKPHFQKILIEFGFKARGYVPCWKYHNKHHCFEDHILFNYYEGELRNIDLLPEGLQLFEIIGLNKIESEGLNLREIY